MMKHNYGLKLFTSPLITLSFLFLLLYGSSFNLLAQTPVTLSTVSTFANNSGNGTVTFNFENTNPYGIEITDIEGIASASGALTCEVWYKTTPVNGLPGAISVANGWTLAMTGSFTGVANTTSLVTQPFITGGSFVVPAGVTWAMAITAFTAASGTGQRYSTTPAAATVISAGGCNMITGPGIGYGGGAPPTAPANNARGWLGKITFRPLMQGYNNAAVGSIVSPTKFCTLLEDIKVPIKNAGKNVINNLTINWELDHAPQTPISLSTPLDTIGGTGKSDTILTLGSVAFSPNVARTIKVWTSLPNGTSDTVNVNDTMIVTLRQGLSGTYVIGGLTPDYPSFNAALSDLTRYGMCGSVIFDVAAGDTFIESPISISNFNLTTDSIVFQKSGTGANPIVYGVGGVGTTDAVITISGSRNIVFNGIDVVDTITNTTTDRMDYGYRIINYTPTQGSSNNIIKNCRVRLQRANTSSIGILQSASTTGGGVAATSLAGANHNNRYENVKIENTCKGIGLIGTPGFPDSSCVITSNGGDTTIIGADVPNDIGSTTLMYGIGIADQRNCEVSYCTVRNLTHTSTSVTNGIFVDNGSTTVNYGTARVFGNTVYNINRTTTTSVSGTVHGIRVDVSTSASAHVYNNLVYNISSSATPATASANQIVRGIAHGTTTGTGNAVYYNNTVSINTPGLNSTSAAFWKGGTGTATVVNNIFENISPGQTGVSKHYGMYLSAGNINSSNNLYWTENANGFVAFVTSDLNSVQALAAATSTTPPVDGNERGSAFAKPNFISATNYRFNSATPAASSGIPVSDPMILTDLDGALRNAMNPSVGAFETAQTLIDSAAPVISNVMAVSGSSPVVYATITDNSNALVAGNVQLWYRLGNSGAFTAVAPDSVPSGSMNGTYKWSPSFVSLLPGTYQYYITARDGFNPGSNISVNPMHSAAFTGFGPFDPAGFINNPDASANTRTFGKLGILSGGTYTVGPTGNYAKLTNVAALLNTTELTGNVVFELQSTYDGTTGEVYPITFNRWATSGGNWQVTIRPAAGATSLVTSGAVASTLIELNGTRKIVFDGRPGGTGTQKQYSIMNTHVNGATFRFINDATNDTLRFLNISGNDTVSTDGVIAFLTTTGTSGNSYNVIDNCNINGSSASTNCIYSRGSAAPADNKNNTITNCNIYDFFSNVANKNVCGISLQAGNSYWNIGTAGNGNNFYQTSARTTVSVPALSNAVSFKGIFINDASVTGCSITGNTIGGNIPGIPGSTFVIGSTSTNVPHTLVPIDNFVSSPTVPTSIQGNTISDISFFSTVSNSFIGIHARQGLFNIGDVTGNVIGSPTGNSSIVVNHMSSATSANYYGIRCLAAGGVVQNNIIGSITGNVQNSSGSMQLLCIYTNGTLPAPLTVSNNYIGSATTQHSIQSLPTSLGGVNIMGLCASAATGAMMTFSNNTVSNLSALCPGPGALNAVKGVYVTGASSIGTVVSGNVIKKLYSLSTNPLNDQSSSVLGINCTASGAGSQVISGNTIYDLSSGVSTPAAVNVVGVYYGSANTSSFNIIEKNTIFGFMASSSNPSALISGITQAVGAVKLVISNNMVSLGKDSSGNSDSIPHFITGIQKTGGAITSTLHNTVRISGTVTTAGVLNTYAYRSNFAGNDSLVNNIFVNERTNTTSGGNHYAVGLSTAAQLVTDYNMYHGGSSLAILNNIDYTSLNSFKAATLQDDHSQDTIVHFVSGNDLHFTAGSTGRGIFSGVPLAAVTTDIDNQARSTAYPYMGADEDPSNPLPVHLILFHAAKAGNHVAVKWVTGSEQDLALFVLEVSTDGRTFKEVARVTAKGNSRVKTNYSFMHEHAFISSGNAQVLYYRLRSVDQSGAFSLSEIAAVEDDQRPSGLTAYPNPFSDQLKITISSTHQTTALIDVVDLMGNVKHSLQENLAEGANPIIIDLATLPQGIYFIRTILNGEIRIIKAIKE